MSFATFALYWCVPLDVVGLVLGIWNCCTLWRVRHVTPGLSDVLLGTVAMMAWLALWDVVTWPVLITGPSAGAIIRFVGNRVIFVGFQARCRLRIWRAQRLAQTC